MPPANHISIDSAKCVGCAECVRDCPMSHLYLENGKARAHDGACLECGHCFAVCPQGAVDMTNYNTSVCGPAVPMSEFDSNRLLEAMRSRRSVRRFTSEPVSERELDMILEAGRCCPTAKNTQNVAYTVLGSKQEAIERECVNLFRRASKLASAFSETIRNVEIGDDFFFKGAPLAIVVSSDSEIDAALASSYMELMAASLGLGAFYCGYFTACCRMSAKVRGMLALPEGHKAVTCLVVGHPAVEYKRTVPRKPLRKTVL